tara:strand:+ start:402 stop:1538 length:1137 start_codon:yes stop_codon:yes gene_type:complete
MNHLSNPFSYKALLSLGAFFILTATCFSQGEAPRTLSVKNAFSPLTEIAVYLDVRGAEESGFAKKAEAELPQIMEGIDDATEEMGEFTEVTGIALEDIAELSISLTGTESLFESMQNGEDPDFGPNGSVLGVARLDKPMDVRKMVNSILNKVREEEGPEAQRMILSSIIQFRGATIFVMPPEMVQEADVPFPIAIGVRAIGKDAFLAVGKERDVKGFFAGGKQKPGAAPFAPQVRKGLPADSQMWMSMAVPEAILQEAVQELRQNPMLAGFATVIVKMREVGVSLQMKNDSMGVNLAAGFDDTKSATQMWQLSQGLLAMAKLAASGEGAEMPAFITKLTSVVKGKATVFATEITIDDLEMMAGASGGDFDGGDPAAED